MRLLTTLFLSLTLISTQALSDVSVGLNLASYHVNPTMGFNESNSGVLIEYETESNIVIQVGVFENSYSDTSRYLQLGYSEPWHSNEIELSSGVFVGLYEYANLTNQVIGDYIVAGGLDLTASYKGFFVTTQLIPIGLVVDEADAIITLQIGQTF